MNVFLQNVSIELVKIGRRRPWLAEASGTNISTINNWFAYDRWPQVDHAYRVSVALGISLPLLMGAAADEQHLYPDWVKDLARDMLGQSASRGKAILAITRAIIPTWTECDSCMFQNVPKTPPPGDPGFSHGQD